MRASHLNVFEQLGEKERARKEMKRETMNRRFLWIMIFGWILLCPCLSQGQDQEEGVKVTKIGFIRADSGVEKFMMVCSRECIPELSVIQGKKPRVVLDLKNVTYISPQYRKMDVDGRFVQWIRTYLNRENKTLRVVLDMNAAKHYRVNPVQYQAENTFVLEIMEDSR